MGPLWMQSTQFAGLARILHLFRTDGTDLRAKELNERIIRSGIYETRRGATPSATTLYHCRNILFRIGALIRVAGRYRLAERPEVHAVLSNTHPGVSELNWEARDAFADLVLQNDDCQARFFSLFAAQGRLVTAADFRSSAVPVSWRPTLSKGGRYRLGVALESIEEAPGQPTLPTRPMTLEGSRRREISSILYGVRYWALNELRLIDECFDLGRGSVMFSIKAEDEAAAAELIRDEITEALLDGGVWKTFSLQSLVDRHCIKGRRPVGALHLAIKKLAASHPGKVVLIPSAESFATNTLSSTFPATRRHELKSYYRDSSERLISHVRLHSSIARMSYAWIA